MFIQPEEIDEIPETEEAEDEKRAEEIRKKIEAYYEGQDDEGEDDFYDRTKKRNLFYLFV